MERRYWKLYSREVGLTGFGEGTHATYAEACKYMETIIALHTEAVVVDNPDVGGEIGAYRVWYLHKTWTNKNQYYYSLIPLIPIADMPEEARPEDWRP